MVITVKDLVDQAELGVVEIVWFVTAMQTCVPEKGHMSIEVVALLTWEIIEPALDKWAAQTLRPSHGEVIRKIRLAASDLIEAEEIRVERETLRFTLPMCEDCGASASIDDLQTTCTACGRGIIGMVPITKKGE